MNATAAALESLELYKGANGGPPTKVDKLDVVECLQRTAPDFFAALAKQRVARIADVLGGYDPLAAASDFDPEAVDAADDADAIDADIAAAATDVAFSLRGKTVVVTGASRGIGEAIAVRCASRGANVVILAQTTVNNSALPGTIQDAAAACVAVGGEALAIKTDITDETQVAAAVAAAVARFGGIDILVNNASTHWPTRTVRVSYNTMMGVNVKGSYLVSRACMPHLLLSPNPHVLTIAPAPVADHTWLSPHTVYSTSKIAMSFLSLALEAEFGGTTVAGGRGGRQGGVAFNTLWPRYAVATAAINFIGGERLAALSRTPAAVADAAFRIVTSPALQLSGRHFIDDDVLRAAGVVRFERYNVSPNVTEPVSDFFVSNDAPVAAYEAPRALPRPADKGSRGRGRVSDGGGGGSGGDGGDGGVVLLVVNAENGEDRRLCAAVARRVLRAGHKLALMAHHRREPASRKSPTSSERKQRMTAGGAREASDAVADELMEDIQSGASAAAAADAEPTETETETETEAEAAASEASVKDVKKRVFVQAVDLTDAKTIPDAIVGVVRRFYSVDAVVNLLRPTTAVASAAAGAAASTPGADFDELFDVLVRASFIVVREALPHLARSEGPRRIVALCPPPLAIRDHFRPTAPAPTLSPSPGAGGADGEDEASDGSAARCSRPALALARACQGLHLVGQAAEFAEVEPPIAVNGLWASDSASHDVEDGEEEEEENEDDDERLARAVALMLAAPPPAADAAAAAAELGDRNVAKDNAQLASGTFWRVEDVLGGGGGGGGTGSRARYKNHAAVAAACSTAAADSDAVLHPATTSSSSVAGASGVRDVLLPGYTTRDVVFPDPAEALAALLGGCGGREATLGWGL